jgi:hypothetical protein
MSKRNEKKVRNLGPIPHEEGNVTV